MESKISVSAVRTPLIGGHSQRHSTATQRDCVVFDAWLLFVVDICLLPKVIDLIRSTDFEIWINVLYGNIKDSDS